MRETAAVLSILIPHSSLTHMHILLLTHYYEPEVGAPQRRWSAIVERLTARGYSVTVLCPPPHYPDRSSTQHLRTSKNKVGNVQIGRFGETIYRMPYLLHGYSGKIRAIDQLVTAVASCACVLKKSSQRTSLGRPPFDVVISTVPGLPSLFAGVVIGKILRIPHVAEMRDAWPDVVTGDLMSQTQRLPRHKKLVKQLIYRLVSAGQRDADAVVTTTEWFSSILHTRGIRNVFVVPNGAEENDFSSIKPLTPHSAQHRPLRLQYLGTVGRSQGLEVFVSALYLLKQQRPDLEFASRIVGEGAEIPLLKKMAQDAEVSIEFVGTVARDQLIDAYSWADVELVSLRKTKPFMWTIPSKIFELLATRRHIVAAVEGSAASIVQKSGVGTVVEPGNAQALADALAELADNPAKLQTGESGLDLLRSTFSYDSMATLYEDLLKKTVEAKTRRLHNTKKNAWNQRFTPAKTPSLENAEAL